MQEVKIGVYVCHCGSNIAGTVNIKEVIEKIKKIPNVKVVKDYVFMCSAIGQDIIKKDIKELNLNRIVVAACSPDIHEVTFRNAMKEAELNPYLLEMANIREHCSWVHSKEKATEKAIAIIKSSISKVSLLEPLEEIKFDVKSRVIIVGGGISGLKAAVDLADKGYLVDLIERLPTVGGNALKLGKLSQINVKGSDIVNNLIKIASSKPNIRIHTNSELIDFSGFVGNFKVKIKIKPRFVDLKCTKCGECEKVCPVETLNEYECKISKRKAIYLPSKYSYPSIYVIDPEICTKCGECEKVCPVNAINLNEKEKEIEIDAGALILATGFEPYEPPEGEYGYKKSDKIITLLQLERYLDNEGITKGKLILNGEHPKNLGFIMCVGSLNTTTNSYQYCSRMCCSSVLKNALILKEKYPEMNIYIFYKDIRTYFKDSELLYWEAIIKGIKFIRFEKSPEVIIKNEKVFVKVYDETLGVKLEIPLDLLVLAIGIAPSKHTERVRQIVKVGCGPEGFIKEAHLKLRPSETPTDGIFIAGTVAGPKNTIESMISGGAAASKVSCLLEEKEVTTEAFIAKVKEEICSGCAICISVCPYDAISPKLKQVGNETKRNAEINPALCKACGLCAATCPSAAIQQYGFKDEQIFSQLVSLLEDKKKDEPIIIMFACKWCSYAATDLAGTSRMKYPHNIRIIRVMCSGRVDPQLILEAFKLGADGVLLTGCRLGDCHYVDGNYNAMRKSVFIKHLLEQLKIEKERFRLEFISSSEAKRFVEIANEFVNEIKKLGNFKAEEVVVV